MSDIQLITSQLLDPILLEIKCSSSIYILTSFAMESGVRLLLPALCEAAERGVDIKMLTGDYLYVTQPEALSLLLELKGTAEVRLWHSDGVSFHPKAYLFEREDGKSRIVVGSSNLSRSALTQGVEWNVMVSAADSLLVVEEAVDTYLKMFYSEKTVPVNPETVADYQREYEQYQQRYAGASRMWSEQEAIEVMFSPEATQETNQHPNEEDGTESQLVPREVQLQALQQLENTRSEGYKKAMIVMATGLGKTYLAGFFARNFARTLFIAHREEILHQAKRSLQQVMPEKTHGLYDGKEKDPDADCVYASIYTLSRQKHIERFAPHDFDLLVVDEFHHAAAASYERVMDYFQPAFLLGITATPDRLDGRDVFAICDGNVAYQIHFIEAIQHGWLAPFQYYGVYDDTDYSAIRWLGNRYDEAELQKAQMREERAEKIFAAYQKHRQTRTLGFCSSIAQADFLADYFTKQNVRAISLHSRSCNISRGQAIRMIETGELDIIFTIDLFNEGVDIPSLDTLLFVRPTESLAVFTQQVGRGLRLYSGKQCCTIIDLIGNYRNADVKMRLFDVERGNNQKKREVENVEVPASCEIHLDLDVIDLIKEMARKRQPRKEQVCQAYRQVKREMGGRPTYLDLHLHGGIDGAVIRQEFQSYPAFLSYVQELTEDEAQVYQRYQAWFEEVEKTVMSKSYKMVLLLAMLERGPAYWEKPITPKEAAPFFYRYLTAEPYRFRVEARDKQTAKRLESDDEQGLADLIKKMPMTKWSGSSKGFAYLEQDAFFFQLDMASDERKRVFEWTKEICAFRLHHYFERRSKEPL